MNSTRTSNSSGAYNSRFGPEWLLRYARPETPGEVITFYSYKGGTGRSMALANCAGLMAEHWPADAKPMLLIDFDLEAPGLHQYLRDELPPPDSLHDHPGTLELFETLQRRVQIAVSACRTNGQTSGHLDDEACQQQIDELDFIPYPIKTHLPNVWLIKAGCFDSSYAQRLAGMNWQSLFAAAPGIFRALAARWAKDYACTLIDARTGISDTSGICTMLLPDVLTVVFTPNRQSLAGVDHLVRQAQAYRAQSVDLRTFRVYPLPSRVEQTSEDYRMTWRRGAVQHATFGTVEGYQPLFARLLGENHSDPDSNMNLKAGLDQYFDAVQVPHSPDYAYGERLCFGPQVANDRLSLRTAFEAFLPWMTSASQPWESPNKRLEELQLANWLDELEPSQADDSSNFSDWLSKLQAACGGIASPGFAIARDALAALCVSETGVNDSKHDVLAELLPQATLIHTLVLMQGEQWKEAADLFTRSMDNARQYGLPPAWEVVPSRWLQHQRADGASSYLHSWLKSGCGDAMQDWVEAVRLSRMQTWHWLGKLIEVFGDFQPVDVRRSKLISRLLEQQRTVLGDEHPETLSSMNNLASTLEVMREYDAARIMREKVLAIRKRVLGDEHPDTLTSMNFALTLKALGDLAGARTLQEQALAVNSRVLGKEHPNTLTSMSNLASTLKALGDLTGARKLEEQTLAIRRRVLGEEHPDTLTSTSNLASMLKIQGDLTGARRLEEQTLAVRQRVLGEEHPDTLTSMDNLASTLKIQGYLAEARALQESALAARQRQLGDEHTNTLTSISNLAVTLLQQGDLSGARTLQEQALAVHQRVLGDEHPNTLTSMSNLASTLKAQGDLAGARTLEERTLALRRRVLGKEHPDTLTSMSNVASTLSLMNEDGAARSIYEEVLAARTSVLGTEHPDTLESLSVLFLSAQKTQDPVAITSLLTRYPQSCSILFMQLPNHTSSRNHEGLASGSS